MRPASFAAASIASASVTSSANGLSTSTCLPAASAAIANGACWSLGGAITTASTAGSSKTCCGVARTCA
ncbi:hypothetical protein G6F52_014229 [Rhizopus delemar]|nr:hypothetical protein G6F52_014229 [Rhizopus delemar]